MLAGLLSLASPAESAGARRRAESVTESEGRQIFVEMRLVFTYAASVDPPLRAREPATTEPPSEPGTRNAKNVEAGLQGTKGGAMKHFLIAWMCVALASPAGWAQQGAAPDVENPADAESTPGRPVIADVLVCIDIDASPGLFHDLTQRYVDAFTAAGAATVATAATEVSGGSINFPPDLTAANYPVVVVLGSDNYLTGPNTIDANDEAALAAYLDTGGSLLLVGQDYMYGAHPDMDGPGNPCYGFPRDYLGLDICYQDFDTPPPGLATREFDPRSAEATITGTLTWIFVGMVFLLVAVLAFPNTGYFLTDRATTTRTGGVGFGYEGQYGSGDGVVTYNQTRGFKTVWSGVELAGADADDFDEIIATLYDWLDDSSPVERASWGAVKAKFR